MDKQVVSKKRVMDHGEVYTSRREVNAMLDLVKQETENIDSRFLEPACGTGNFLTEILERKLRVVESRYRKNQLEYERYLVHVVCSIYGIDILEDNVLECRQRLFEIVDSQYTRLYKTKAKDECRRVIRFVLERNIIWGDALTLKTVGSKPHPIVFSEWSFPFHNSLIKRRDFIFSDLLPDDRPPKQRDLFSKDEAVSIEGHRYFIPQEMQTFPPIHYLKVGKEDV